MMLVLRSRRAAVLSTLAALAAGCSEIPATNPFDPTTPVTQRAPGRLVGHLSFEGVDDLGPEAYSIQVRDAQGGLLLDDEGPRVWKTRVEGDTLPPELDEERGVVGAFEIELPSGTYSLHFDADVDCDEIRDTAQRGRCEDQDNDRPQLEDASSPLLVLDPGATIVHDLRVDQVAGATMFGCFDHRDCPRGSLCVEGQCAVDVDSDRDQDGVPDGSPEAPRDNCLDVPNTDQADNDGDGDGDACDDDDDNDGVDDGDDNCPRASNPNQEDGDNDGTGDACEDDADGDGVPDANDNCPDDANGDQVDTDDDGFGNECDDDDDGDGDLDGDDNCPLDANGGQQDADNDGAGDVCDDDRDGDGVPNVDDNCPDDDNADQTNSDLDDDGDACDGDDDGDGVDDGDDNCPLDANAGQENSDNDANGGDACDPDDDNDGVADVDDNCPNDANPNQEDADDDGTGDACEGDSDGDGVADGADNCPDDANPNQDDLDNDDDGDACDADDDNDGVPDVADNCPATLGGDGDQTDTDGDGEGNVCDDDDDGDGDLDGNDNCPIDANEDQEDQNNDGEGDACDPDIDGDGVANGADSCPTDVNTGDDSDNDGVDDACDPDAVDSDGDGVNDQVEINCGLDPDDGDDAAGDNDHDGNTNGDECIAGTPFEPIFFLREFDPGQAGQVGVEVVVNQPIVNLRPGNGAIRVGFDGNLVSFVSAAQGATAAAAQKSVRGIQLPDEDLVRITVTAINQNVMAPGVVARLVFDEDAAGDAEFTLVEEAFAPQAANDAVTLGVGDANEPLTIAVAP